MYKLPYDLQRWRTVGCQLCYASNGRPEPDHTLSECRASSYSESAIALAQQLDQEILATLFDGGLDGCKLCEGTDYVCQEICLQQRIADAGGRKSTAWLDEKRKQSGRSTDACEMRPVVRDTLAALYIYDQQFLGQLMGRWLLNDHSVDTSVPGFVELWLKDRITVGSLSVSKILLIFEFLVRAFDYRKTKTLDPGARTEHTSDTNTLYGTERELEGWVDALTWWRHRCGFCAGRGLCDDQIQHSLVECTRGGAGVLQRGFGECFYGGDWSVKGGCKQCAVPREICRRWKKDAKGKWIRDPTQACQFGRQAYDTVIGIFNCTAKNFRMGLLAEVMEATGSMPDHEDVAEWLCQPITLANGFVGSEMMRTLFFWTGEIRNKTL